MIEDGTECVDIATYMYVGLPANILHIVPSTTRLLLICRLRSCVVFIIRLV